VQCPQLFLPVGPRHPNQNLRAAPEITTGKGSSSADLQTTQRISSRKLFEPDVCRTALGLVLFCKHWCKSATACDMVFAELLSHTHLLEDMCFLAVDATVCLIPFPKQDHHWLSRTSQHVLHCPAGFRHKTYKSNIRLMC
jgi:hypothetical protein